MGSESNPDTLTVDAVELSDALCPPRWLEVGRYDGADAEARSQAEIARGCPNGDRVAPLHGVQQGRVEAGGGRVPERLGYSGARRGRAKILSQKAAIALEPVVTVTTLVTRSAPASANSGGMAEADKEPQHV